MKSIAVLSKSPEAIGDAIAESIGKAFEDLAKALNDSVQEIKQAKEDQGGLLDKAVGAIKDATGMGKNEQPKPATTATAVGKPKSDSGSKDELSSALSKALSGYFDRAVISVKKIE
jgi:hypothetical protein